MTTETVNATVNATSTSTLTPRSELYKVAYLAGGSAIIALHCAKMTEADMAAESAHYEKTGRVRGPEVAIAVPDRKTPTTFVSGFVECEGKDAKTMFGDDNLGRQVRKHGSLSALLKARFGYTGKAIASGAAAAAEVVDVESRLKAIREEETRLLAIVAERAAKAEEALNALTAQVKEFIDIDEETLKDVLKAASATDLATGMRAAKAFLA